jgi:hypothetical protein
MVVSRIAPHLSRRVTNFLLTAAAAAACLLVPAPDAWAQG